MRALTVWFAACALMMLAACDETPGAPSPDAASQPAGLSAETTRMGPRPFVTVRDGRFVDGAGRQVILHGINVQEKSKAKNYLSWHGPEQFAAMREWGFNCVRLLISWDGLEPAPGKYDETYLAGVDQRIAWAKEQGLYVLLDMHQDLYGVKFGNGAPLWATLDEGKPHVAGGAVWSDAYLTSAAVQTAFDNFWANKPGPDGVGIQDRFALAWRYVAQRYADEPAVLGYDLLNEPFLGSRAPGAYLLAFAKAAALLAPAQDPAAVTVAGLVQQWSGVAGRAALMQRLADVQLYAAIVDAAGPVFQEFERTALSAMYRRVGEAIRQVDRNHVLFIEGSVSANIGIPAGVEPLTGSDGATDALQAFAPHAYDIVTDTPEASQANGARVELIFSRRGETSKRLGLPMLIGEWGAYYGSPDTLPAARVVVRQLEKLLCGDTYWDFHEGILNAAYFKMLKRPYPQAVVGALLSYHADPETGLFECAWKENGDATEPTCIYVPDVWYPRGHETSVSPPGPAYRVAPIAGAQQSAYLLVPPLGHGVIRQLVIRPI